MFGLLRNIVAGPKNKLQWNGLELDLTYITDRIIAMAFPASGFQKTYRNSIKDVAKYLQQNHGKNYLIINVSSRQYDYSYFHNRVKDYDWPDHQAPPLTTLFQISRDIYQFLANNQNSVVAVHCNHGKGRTGTAIISFMLFTRFFQKYDETLKFYNKRRFISSTYGVDQPCQRRYLQYFQKIIFVKNIPKKLTAYQLKSIKHSGLADNYYLQISTTRTGTIKHNKLFFTEKKIKFNRMPLIGDIFIQLIEKSWTGSQKISRINYNLYFLKYGSTGSSQQLSEKKTLHENQKKLLKEVFKGENIKVNGKHSLNFRIQIEFEPFCDCHNGLDKKQCPCMIDRLRQEEEWSKMIANIEIAKKIQKPQACLLLFNSQQTIKTQLLKEQKEQKILQNEKNQKIQKMCELKQNNYPKKQPTQIIFNNTFTQTNQIKQIYQNTKLQNEPKSYEVQQRSV